MRWRIGPLLTATALFALVAVLAVGRPASAHSGAPLLILAEQAAGPYTISVWADPDVGNGRLFVEATVGGAQVPPETTVTARVWPDDGHLPEATYTGTRTSSPLGPERFTVRVPFDAEGVWWVQLAIRGPAGLGEVTFSVTATPAESPFSVASLLCLAPFAAIAALWWWGARRVSANPRGTGR